MSASVRRCMMLRSRRIFAEGLGVVHEAHILEAAEGHAENQLLHFLLGIAALGEDAGCSSQSG